MQEDINQKTIAIAIKTGKVTARVLRDVLRALLRHWSSQRQKNAHSIGNDEVVNHGKKTLKQLQAQGHELTRSFFSLALSTLEDRPLFSAI